jgi:hypothetical protein
MDAIGSDAHPVYDSFNPSRREKLPPVVILWVLQLIN